MGNQNAVFEHREIRDAANYRRNFSRDNSERLWIKSKFRGIPEYERYLDPSLRQRILHPFR